MQKINWNVHFQLKTVLSYLILFAILLSAGFLLVYHTWTRSLENKSNRALNLAMVAEAGFQSSSILKMALSPGDLNKLEYKQLKSSLINLVSLNSGMRFAYILVKNENEIYFLADSEPENSKDYSPPGQPYHEASATTFQTFQTGKAIITKPESDRWGTWVSALVPIKDINTNQVIAVFGVDYPAKSWYDESALDTLQTGLIFICILIILHIFYVVVRKSAKLKALSKKMRKSEEMFRTVFEQAPIGLAVGGTSMTLSDINPMFETITGRSKEELANLEWTRYTHPDDVQNDLDHYTKYMAGEISGYSIVKRYIKPDGSIVWVNKKVAPLKLFHKDENHHLCIIEDINSYLNVENALIESRRSNSILLNNIPGMAYRCKYNDGWTLEFVSEGCLELTGYTAERLLNNKTLSYYRLVSGKYRDYLLDCYKHAEKRGKVKAEYEIKTASGEIKWVLEQGQGIFYPDGSLAAIEGIIIDITARRMREEEIVYMNDHDSLTNLYNRGYFEQEARRLDTVSSIPISVIIGNINGLRLVNDAFGRDEGDKLIIETAQILKNCCGETSILARTGGDEFSILLPLTDNKTAYETVNKIKTACDVHKNKQTNKDYQISISLGVDTKVSEDQHLNGIIKNAEDAMYKRKLIEHKSSHSYILSSIKTTLSEKSRETQEHADRMSELMKQIGRRMGLSPIEIHELEMLSMLHDIGKIGIDDRVLKKPGKLNHEEWAEMKRHPEIGYRIAMSSPDMASTAEYILSHHERWDGSGYPKGLKGEEIPLLSRILSVVDAYDAMTQDRVYRKALTREEAVSEIEKNSGIQFDPEIVNVFLSEVL